MSSASTLQASPRHLADVAFRFGPPAPSHTTLGQNPEADGDWTLDAVLEALARGAGVFESRTGLRLRHAHRRPGLAKALNRYAAEVRAWLELGLTNRPVDQALRPWPLRVRLYVAWLDAVLLPSDHAIQLAPGVAVTDRRAFRAAIQDRLIRGPETAAASALVGDLTSLFLRYAPVDRQQTSPARHIPLAA